MMALVCDQVRLMARDHPDATAYRVVDQGELTFREWDRQASRLARGLVAAGVGAQDRVALLSTPEDALYHLITYTAVHKAGAINVPINTRLARPELGAVLAHAEPSAAVVSPELLGELQAVAPPSLRTVVVTRGEAAGAVSWEEALSDDSSDLQIPVSEDDIADILYTSGTTGLPKGVVVRHCNATQMPVGPVEHFSGAIYLHASPLFTFAGTSFIFIPQRLGMTGMYMPRFDAGRWLEIVERERVLMAFLVPAMVELILAHPDVERRDLSSIQLLSVGSAPIAPSSLLRLQELMPNASVSNSYSMSEAGTAYCVMPKGELHRRPGSVGKPVPPFEFRIVDDEGRDLPPGEVGEVLIKVVGRPREYYKDPQATAALWRDGWLYTGDLGMLDEDGYLYIVGRKKDVIIRGGHNVYATDVETVLHDHPDVLEAAVVGVPHDVLGEDIAAVVVAKPGHRIDLADLERWCAERLADYKRPRRIVVVDELPRNAMGKVLKRVLIEQLTASSR